VKLLRNIVSEIIGLFVDDWAFAALALAWVALFALPGVRAHASSAGPALFGGLAVLTLVFVARRAGR